MPGGCFAQGGDQIDDTPRSQPPGTGRQGATPAQRRLARACPRISLRHLPGDRREYFEAPEDVWEIFRVLATERRRREIEPTLSMLRSALLVTPDNEAERHAQARMREMHDLIERLMSWFDEIQKLQPETAMQLMDLGSKVTKVLEMRDALTGRGRARKAAERATDGTTD